MAGPQILTQRLRLSQLVASDAPAMFEYRSDPVVCRYQSFEPGTLADVEAFIDRIEPNEFDTSGTWFQFGIWLQESKVLIGDIGAHFMSDDSRQVEIGFTISPKYQGQGFGTESVSSLLKYLLADCEKHRVFASVDPRNEPSVKLLKRVGMRQEAHFRQSLWFKGEWADDMVFGVLKSEWDNQAPRVNLGAIQETLMLPLWARAKETDKQNPIVCDPYAKNIVEKIDYDFSQIEEGPASDHQGVWAIRAYNFDNITKEFLANNSEAVVVNIGAGLDTSFQRIDDGSVMWINIDLPDVVALRQKLLPDSEREMTIAKSVFDFTWIDDISPWLNGRSILFMAAGVLCYFEKQEVETIFCKLAEIFPSSHVIFDSMSWFVAWGTNREILKKSKMDALIKWHPKGASDLQTWVDTIKVIEEYPMLSKFPARNDFSKTEIMQIKIVGLFRFYNMIHVQL